MTRQPGGESPELPLIYLLIAFAGLLALWWL